MKKKLPVVGNGSTLFIDYKERNELAFSKWRLSSKKLQLQNSYQTVSTSIFIASSTFSSLITSSYDSKASYSFVAAALRICKGKNGNFFMLNRTSSKGISSFLTTGYRWHNRGIKVERTPLLREGNCSREQNLKDNESERCSQPSSRFKWKKRLTHRWRQ